MQAKNKKIVCFGEVLYDVLPKQAIPGGAPMNAARHFERMGMDVTLVSRVGSDQKGVKLTNFLNKSGLNTSFVQVDPSLPTSEVLVKLDENNTATYEIKKPVAWDNIRLDDDLVKKVQQSGVFVYGSLAARSQSTRQTLKRLLHYDNLRVIDVNLRPPYDTAEVALELLAKADIAKLNIEELDKIAQWSGFSELPEDGRIRTLYEKYAFDYLIVTYGSEGAKVFDGKQIHQHPGYKVKTADSVGAGDAFLSGFLYKMLNENAAVPDALDFACAAGALVASRDGATPDYNLDNIEMIKKTGN
jgi:fructokinase